MFAAAAKDQEGSLFIFPIGTDGVECFLALVEIFAQPGVAPALLRGSDLLAQLVFTPLTSVMFDRERLITGTK